MEQQTVEFNAGAKLIEQGKIEGHAYIIETGSVRITIREGDQDHIVGIAGAGDVVGEMALFEDAPRSASVVALESTRADRVTRERLAELMDRDPGACMPFFKVIMERLRTSNLMMVAGQKTRDMIKTTHIKLTFEPLSEEARKICNEGAVIEMDVAPNEGTAQILIQRLQKHFKVDVQTSLPGMER